MRRSTLSMREQDALDTLTEIGDLRKHVRAVVAAMDLRCAAAPYHVLVVYGPRSAEEQDRLYAQGRTAPGPRVTNAKSGQSAHNFAAAADIALVRDDGRGWLAGDDPAWGALAELVRGQGLVTGSDFKAFADRAHMELRDWPTLARAGTLTLWHDTPAPRVA